jgi:hypothetical protein
VTLDQAISAVLAIGVTALARWVNSRLPPIRSGEAAAPAPEPMAGPPPTPPPTPPASAPPDAPL